MEPQSHRPAFLQVRMRYWSKRVFLIHLVLMLFVAGGLVYGIHTWWPQTYLDLAHGIVRALASLNERVRFCPPGDQCSVGANVMLGLVAAELYVALVAFVIILPVVWFVLKFTFFGFGIGTFLVANTLTMGYLALILSIPVNADAARFAQDWQLVIIPAFAIPRIAELVVRGALLTWRVTLDYLAGFVTMVAGVYLVGKYGPISPLSSFTFFAMLAPVLEFFQLHYLYKGEKSRDEV
ncbi:hypothetical protein FJY94_02435 [Candidatus Kaiserbacteria bacterium]|nr:hypothetical protein [Candidatus Kaiserbacteria bacterium]